MPITLLFLLLIATSLFPFGSSLAQNQTIGQTWKTPVNLSHSGSTINPSIVIDSIGFIHGVWEDTTAGEMYTGFYGTQWGTPIPVNLPFAPYLLVGLHN